MAIVFEDDFESGDISAWSSGSGGVSTTEKYEGTYGGAMENASTYNWRTLMYDFSPNPTEIYFRFYVKRTGYFEAATLPILFTSQQFSGATSLLRATENSTVSSQFLFRTNNADRSTTTAEMSVDTWYLLEGRLNFAGASAVCEIKFLGETHTDTTNITDSNHQWLHDGGTWNNAPAGLYVDAVVINDGDGYIGPLSDAPPFIPINTGLRPAFFKPGLSR